MLLQVITNSNTKILNMFPLGMLYALRKGLQ